MTKTYEECLNEVAKKDEWENWNHFIDDDGRLITIFKYMKEAALLYGEAQYNKGVEDQEQAEIHYMETGKLIKPTFKP